MTDPSRSPGGRRLGPAEVRLEIRGGIACICFDRPPVNAFTIQMFGEFRSLMDKLADDLRPVLLTGANGMFSAGFDIKQPGLDAAGPSEAAHQCLTAIQEHPAPVVAAVEGAAVGLGLLIAVSADILVVSRSARLRMPEMTLGIVPDVAPLRRFLPNPWIRRMCLLGESFTAGDMQLDSTGVTVCDPGASEEAAAAVIDSFSSIERSLLERTKRRLAE
jgi:enoyl-CoA hydratase